MKTIEDEAEIRDAFEKTLAVRGASRQARELADRFFFETLVRVHRAGEGAPYTGLKDEPIEPIIAMAEKALETGSAAEMIDAIKRHAAAAIQEKFDRAVDARKSKDDSVESGREFVEAYVGFLHYIEGLHAAMVSMPGHGQTVEPAGERHGH